MTSPMTYCRCFNMPNLNLQKSIVTFSASESHAAMVIKLNEYVVATDKRISDLEKENKELKEKVTDLEIHL
jgi:hypothetical protein